MQKNNFFTLLVVVLLFSLTGIAQNYKADVLTSSVAWEAGRVGTNHDGTVSILEGSFIVENDKLVGGSFVLDMKSIKVLDVRGIKRRRLVKHLKSDDFFDVKKHATGIYKITGSEIKEDKILVKGTLTLKGITKEVNFLATLSRDGKNITLKSDDFNIDRTKWNIKYRSGKFYDNLKNKLIYDDIKIGVLVKASEE